MPIYSFVYFLHTRGQANPRHLPHSRHGFLSGHEVPPGVNFFFLIDHALATIYPVGAKNPQIRPYPKPHIPLLHHLSPATPPPIASHRLSRLLSNNVRHAPLFNPHRAMHVTAVAKYIARCPPENSIRSHRSQRPKAPANNVCRRRENVHFVQQHPSVVPAGL